jgi:hypothetical protein
VLGAHVDGLGMHDVVVGVHLWGLLEGHLLRVVETPLFAQRKALLLSLRRVIFFLHAAHKITTKFNPKNHHHPPFA